MFKRKIHILIFYFSLLYFWPDMFSILKVHKGISAMQKYNQILYPSLLLSYQRNVVMFIVNIVAFTSTVKMHQHRVISCQKNLDNFEMHITGSDVYRHFWEQLKLRFKFIFLLLALFLHRSDCFRYKQLKSSILQFA